ncbi:conserved protein of unknown function [Bradyrhizobium sp. ORS 285]|uniref:hypothetical protein n=1 Tax=Bradyrhizobium sp. ORS 285 TaxID=115808 RepID=UPI000240A01C|nr:hypothetical protein [Bradyrhizobium sp. ORS 285]CCD86413.1 conserved hypothetical protein [Bradyrhizobium sp. ORS 285]SMX58825.1 conserved protein of unknown function [Bradyrhizobium sp. ORS 285]
MTQKRNRRKQTVSFADRLQQAALAARNAAQLLPAGPEREMMLKKALQAETAAHINELLSAPIMQAAER